MVVTATQLARDISASLRSREELTHCFIQHGSGWPANVAIRTSSDVAVLIEALCGRAWALLHQTWMGMGNAASAVHVDGILV
jgi:hypothetical protein